MTPTDASAARRDALRRFAVDFDRGAYWDAHEHLESWWASERHELWQALIQIAAALVLVQTDRPDGAARVLNRALQRLRRQPDGVFGVDVAAIRGQCIRIAAGIDDGATLEALHFDIAPLLPG